MSRQPVVHRVFPREHVAEVVRQGLAGLGATPEKDLIDRLLPVVKDGHLDELSADSFVVSGDALVEVSDASLRRALSVLALEPDLELFDAYLCDGSGFCGVRLEDAHVHLWWHIPWTEIFEVPDSRDLRELWEHLPNHFGDESDIIQKNKLGLYLARDGDLPPQFSSMFVFRLREETMAALEGWSTSRLEAVAHALDKECERETWAAERDGRDEGRFALERAGKLRELAALIREQVSGSTE